MGSRSAPSPKPPAQATLSQIEARFAPCLCPSLLEQNLDKHFSRERIYTLARTFWCWIWQILQANTSCREVVRQVQALFAFQGAGRVDEDTAGYCLARGKLSLPWLEKILLATVDSCQKTAPSSGLLQGRALRVVDGSGVRLADTPSNRQAFPPSTNQKPGTGFPYMRVIALFCLSTGAILARATATLREHESHAVLSFRAALAKGDILIADRAYGLYVFAALLGSWGVDLIARLATRNRRVDYRQALQKLAPNDALFLLKKGSGSKLLSPQEWAALPSELIVRIIRHRITQKGFRSKMITLLTTLLDPIRYPKEEILQAYLLRWRLEMCLDDLKTTLGMETLSCLSAQMVQKELLLFLIAHNFLRWLMLQAAAQEQIPVEAISFKGSLDAFRQWSQALAYLDVKRCTKAKRAQLWRKLLKILANDALPHRPNRREPRAVKRRSKYPCLNEPRSKFKDRPSRNKRRRLASARKRANLN